MMNNTLNQFERTSILLGDTGIQRLAQAHVVIAGLGGVGGHCTEALARAGIGHLTLIDNDYVTASNINRQLIALHSSIGQLKVDVMRARILDIHPACQVNTLSCFLTPENISEYLPVNADYLIDCIDTVPSKVALIATAMQANLPVASSMGAGNRQNVSQVKLADISQTHGCALARLIRTQLRQQGISRGVMTVFSDETPSAPRPRSGTENRPTNGTISYMPPLFGLMLAGSVIQNLLAPNDS